MITEKTYNVSGIVQGVGFRPMCVRIAHEIGIRGSVANTSDGVMLKLQGSEEAIERYLKKLHSDCPDVALIIDVELINERPIQSLDNDFIILKSKRSQRQRVLLPPDMATCKDCLNDIRDKKNRRYRYPFTNCTNCGPRFSIVRSLPYDRPCTTMSVFPMCDTCNSEYTDEHNRRFHAQPNACPDCGPHINYYDKNALSVEDGEKALQITVQMLKAGKIIAIKGLGGFHLACDANNDAAVQLLRTRKRRPAKPFAIMCKDRKQLSSLVEIDDNEFSLLSGARAPIMLLKKKENSSLSPSLAPGLVRLGVMLPYTPLHHLLLDEISPLVMTSANLSGDALVSDNEKAFSQLKDICDGFLVHNREIHMKIDDSVLLPHSEGQIIIRRARGFVPNPIILKKAIAPVFAAGAEMKSTFAFSQDNMIFPSQYLGDLKNLDNAEFYMKALKHFKNLYNFAPSAVAYDMHPLYLSRTLAKKSFPSLPTLDVQHHYAHFAACLAENRYKDEAIGLIMDGTGYGTDGSIWGGEIICGNLDGFKRVGHLLTFRLPGGDRAINEIWRCGFSLLVEAMGTEKALELCEILWHKGEKARQLLKAWNSFPLCSSCGRLFDGVAAIASKKAVVSYDGEAAMELEAIAEKGDFSSEFDISENVIDWRPFISKLACDNSSTAVSAVASALHESLSSAFTRAAYEISLETGIKKVALSGGCWQNSLLLSKALPMLRSRGMDVLTHKLLSPNDECISVGQAYVLGTRLLQD